MKRKKNREEGREGLSENEKEQGKHEIVE